MVYLVVLSAEGTSPSIQSETEGSDNPTQCSENLKKCLLSAAIPVEKEMLPSNLQQISVVRRYDSEKPKAQTVLSYLKDPFDSLNFLTHLLSTSVRRVRPLIFTVTAVECYAKFIIVHSIKRVMFKDSWLLLCSLWNQTC